MSSLKGQDVLVTGGAGFVGSHIVDGLIREGARVRIVDNLLRGDNRNLEWATKNGTLSFEAGDITQTDIWDRVLPGVTTVFHQAALRVNRAQENPDECWSVMVQATFQLLKACARLGVKKVVLASSAIIYGNAEKVPTSENHHLNNNNTWYGVAKAANEQMLNAFHVSHGLSGVALRYFNVYGTRMATKGHTEVLVKWFQALDQNQRVRIFGDGSQSMDWVDVTDVAQANLLAASSDVKNGLFNVGTGVETSMLDLARQFLKANHRNEEPELIDQAPTNAIPRRCADISLAKKDLKYSPKVDLKSGLANMVRWWEQEKAKV